MIKSPFPMLTIREHSLLPIIQGGMGIGISAHKLAGSVAKEGAIGTIASVELRRLHPDIMLRAHHHKHYPYYKEDNLEALDREIQQARTIAGPKGFISVNVMHALKHYADLVIQACKSGANAITMGAGLPFDLPELVKDFKNIALIPILSEERGIRAVLKRWMRKGVLPDAIVIEHPRYAGGHLGASRIQDIHNNTFNFNRVLPEVKKIFAELGLKEDRIPLIPAGGINSFHKIRELFNLGANAVQIGTPFAVTIEGDAHPDFKKTLADAKPEDIVTFMSTAGLPARAILTPWLQRYLKKENVLLQRANPEQALCPRKLECLSHCGLKDGNNKAGQFCIETQLAAAQRGETHRGLFFRGSESLPFGREIHSVRQLLERLLTNKT